MAIDGHVAPGFEPVADAFRENFRSGADHGGALCALVAGEPVVDLWGGHRDREGHLRWERDTLVLVFSATKGVLATAVHRLAASGRLDLDSPVSSYWPEFGQAGKERVTVRHVLAHQPVHGLDGLGRAQRAQQVQPLARAQQLNGQHVLDVLDHAQRLARRPARFGVMGSGLAGLTRGANDHVDRC